jgi:hypothetical protein
MNLNSALWWGRALREQESPEGTPPESETPGSPGLTPLPDRPFADHESRWAAFDLNSGVYVTGSSEEAVRETAEREGWSSGQEPIVVELPDNLTSVRPVWLLADGKKVVAWSIDKADVRRERETQGRPDMVLLYMARL